jgi:hypothetical protein
LIGTALYGLVVACNHSNIRHEMSRQLKLIEEKAKKRKEKVNTGYL